MTSLPRLLASSVLAGAATGSRAFTGVAALTLSASADAGQQPDRFLGRPWVKAVTGLLAAQEYVMDMLPGTPSRLAPFGLASRIAAAAGCGVIITRRASGDCAEAVRRREAVTEWAEDNEEGPNVVGRIAACSGAAVVAAAGTAWLGFRWRLWADQKLGYDWAAAALEDAAAVALAAAAVAADHSTKRRHRRPEPGRSERTAVPAGSPSVPAA